MTSRDPQTFKDLFAGELLQLDIRTDTFGLVLARAQAPRPLSGRRLTRRELNQLHGLYLNALSDKLRQSCDRLPDLVA